MPQHNAGERGGQHATQPLRSGSRCAATPGMSSFVEVGLSREFANRKRAPPPPSNSKPGKGAARHVNNEQKGRSQVRELFDMVFEISIHGLKLPRCRKQRLMPVIVTLPPQYADDLHVNIGMPNSDVADNFLSDGDKVERGVGIEGRGARGGADGFPGLRLPLPYRGELDLRLREQLLKQLLTLFA